jgi:Na+-translocating ferredoxin:NAD+ oxidoreductase RnfE subunit
METQPSTARIALKWGLISAVVSIVYTVVLMLTGNYQNPDFQWINFFIGLIITVATLVLAIKEFRTQNEGYLSFGQGLGVGTLTSAISGLISGGFVLIYLRFIDDSSLKVAQDRAREQWEAQGMSDAQMEQAEQFLTMFTSPGLLFAFSVVGAVILGFILSLILAAILKKDRPVFS